MLKDNFPFTFQGIKNFKIQDTGTGIVLTESNTNLSFSIVSGPFSGRHHSVPPGYKLIEERQIESPKGDVIMLVGYSNIFSPALLASYLFLSGLLGTVIGIILYKLLSNLIHIVDYRAWMLIAIFLLFFLFHHHK